MRMVAEGLPIRRREHGTHHEDILAGEDFLSVFMRSAALREPRWKPRSTMISTTVFPLTSKINTSAYPQAYTPIIRESRSTQYVNPSSITEEPKFTASVKLRENFSDSLPTSKSNEGGTIISVRVSHTVQEFPYSGVTPQETTSLPEYERTTCLESTTADTTIPPAEQNILLSEDHPSLLAEANKNEFSVDESDPITSDNDYSEEYPADVQPLPNIQSAIGANPDYLAQQLARRNVKEKLQPYQTVIFHNGPREPSRARSVSYSTVIQAIPHQHPRKHWDGDHHERQERHYDNLQGYGNHFEKFEDKTQNSSRYYERKEKNWEKSESIPEVSSKKTFDLTERNWGSPERNYEEDTKTYTPLQKNPAYVQAEQNYEVDESVSVMSNGRTHGVQTVQTSTQAPLEIKAGQMPKKSDDNQKVGYVVEGRNYRKYRVEERTSDGFIVGEYGVVSHDDGSLRGVRYTADGTINPRLIYDALMKFLSL